VLLWSCAQDAHVCIKACEGLMLIASIDNDDMCASHMLADTQFVEQMTNVLCALYTSLPNVMDPAEVESVYAKWGSVGHATLTHCIALPSHLPSLSTTQSVTYIRTSMHNKHTSYLHQMSRHWMNQSPPNFACRLRVSPNFLHPAETSLI